MYALGYLFYALLQEHNHVLLKEDKCAAARILQHVRTFVNIVPENRPSLPTSLYLFAAARPSQSAIHS